ncbi:WxcM-like domain-containing protein [Flavobacterium sp.]|uniref:WxcM-like domain-containing protein n=1 Tax=Flavobacterium sp. TaxID=239 RepID=UPI00286E8E4B|nr:WxcM-like domain-containing protein [Flavobacterium sp.]
MLPKLIKGNIHKDVRGNLKYNNDFDLSEIKRVYIIENADNQLKRGWQGHKIEQRWFSVISGKFEIMLLEIDNWENPSENLKPLLFELTSETLDALHIPSGYVTCIQSQELGSKLLVMADYNVGEINDEYKFALEQFECSKI